jgi:hypothetical protein
MRYWRRWMTVSAIGVVGLGLLAVALTRHSAYLYDQGPYGGTYWLSSWDQTTTLIQIRHAAVLGGDPVTDARHVRWQLLAVRPTNLPAGLRLIGVRGMRLGTVRSRPLAA